MFVAAETTLPPAKKPGLSKLKPLVLISIVFLVLAQYYYWDIAGQWVGL